MLAANKRKAVFLLHQEGMGAREMARRLHLSRNTIRAIIRGQGVAPPRPRPKTVRLDEDLLRGLHTACQGRVQRMW